MSDSTIRLKPIHELLTDEEGKRANYYIPAYQRGYRWARPQVKQLLEDIWDFVEESVGGTNKDAFYCLQPLVIQPADGRFEVVDGQQRLTTILLILTYLNQRLAEGYRKELYSITFETRPGFQEFLDAPSEEAAGRNVDFHYLHEAMQEIKAWFKPRQHVVNDFESALLNRTQVIWFRLADKDHPVEAFTRLNAGKIALTDDELIRALFLHRGTSEESEAAAVQLRIASEWDQIEKALQADSFWYFLTNRRGARQNRIGFLFELIAGPAAAEPGTYEIFDVFQRRLKAKQANPEQEWLRIKVEFMRLEEWFEDRALYHIIGFLVNEEVTLNELRQLAEGCTKSEFDGRLRQSVFSRLFTEESLSDLSPEEVSARVQDRLAVLEYGSHNAAINSILLLFNVATLLQNKLSNMRFQFDSFKSQEWNLEHVRSIASDPPQNFRDRQKWLHHGLETLQASGLETELQAQVAAHLALESGEATDALFQPLYQAVLQAFDEPADGEAVHGIVNLALLDEHTNKSYQNAPFAVKRQRILHLDQGGIFVPLCTRNVFLKCYSARVDNALFWSTQDQAGYLEAMRIVLVDFFTATGEVAQ